MDRDSHWNCMAMSHELFWDDIWTKLKEFERWNWSDFGRSKNHYIPVDVLSKEAQQRLCEIEQDDIDGLFELRISKQERIFGIKDGLVFRVLWWDPKHTVYQMDIRR